MHIHILSMFPESIRPYLDSSIMQRAQEKGLFVYTLHNLADWSVKNTRRVDDRPYGGWAGTIITVEPLTHAIRTLFQTFGEMPLFLMTPRGETLTQEFVEQQALHDSLVIICWHYEGIDERIFDIFPIHAISIGSYVLSSWELSWLVLIDSIVRLIPDVLSNESLREESFSQWLERKKEYPQYSRPSEFEGFSVPKELLSWDPKIIESWKKQLLK